MQTMMGKQILALSVLVILCGACISPTLLQSTPSTEVSATNIPIITAISKPTSEPLYPSLQTLCPVDPFVPLNELGLPSEVSLLVRPETLEYKWDEQNQGLFVISPDSPKPTRLDFLYQEGYLTTSSASISPDGNWLVFWRKAIADGQQTSWISSLDGNRQWPLDTSGELVAGYGWLDSETLLLFETPYEGPEEPIFPDPVPPLFRINPFTLDREALTNLPTVEVDESEYYFSVSGEMYILYQNYERTLNQFSWRFFDYTSQTDELVFEWLPVNDPVAPSSFPRLTSQGVVIITYRPYGFDLSAPLSPAEIATSDSYDGVMRSINLPAEIVASRVFPDFANPLHMGLLNYSTDEITSIEGLEDRSSPFYLLDLEQNTIIDYCFSVNGNREISPDGEFMAVTEQLLGNTGPLPKSIYILNLKTGFITKIDGYDFLGWVTGD